MLNNNTGQNKVKKVNNFQFLEKMCYFCREIRVTKTEIHKQHNC